MQTNAAAFDRFLFCTVLSGFSAFWLAGTPLRAQTNIIVPSHGLWKYADDGEDRGLEWTLLSYHDDTWPSGYAPLGYGEPGVITTPTTAGRQVNYFRQTFFLSRVPDAPNLHFRLWRDDLARVYINEALVFDDGFRTGEWMPPQEGPLETSTFHVGSNLVAVEVRQLLPTSSDLVFDFELFTTNSVPPQPGVNLSSPANNSLVRIGADLTAQAAVTGMSNLTAVQFYADDILFGEDDNAPYSAVWTNVPSGSHLLTAVALSPTATATSAPVRVTAVANLAPAVQITSPAANAIVGTGNITIRATASDGDGFVTNVAFFEGANRIGDVAVKPYEFLWTNVSVGEYFLTARAADNEGLTATSAVVRIEVQIPPPAGLRRGPYLQIGTPTSIIVKWRTDVASNSRVRFGTNEANLNDVADDSTLVIDHEVKLTNLKPDTRYWYDIGSAEGTLASGPDYSFVTAPAHPKPTRIWAIGDSGTASGGAQMVATAYQAFTGSRYTDLWLMLGDNAYGAGTDSEYQRAVFDFYPRMLRQTVLWPTLGNHDGSSDYYDIFTLPTQGEAGGLPSGSEHYYSFEYGNIHFICLDAAYSPRGQAEAMCTWLRADLENHTNEWLIAFWHQPPYSHGSHNSDVEIDLVQMRENAVPILEQYGVDLVLCGHSHCYERSYFLNGHYGISSTLNPSTMFVDAGNGRADGAGAYRKATSGPQAGRGAVYVVAGSSGWATFGSLDHPAMYFSRLQMGSFVIDVDGPRLDAKFLSLEGQVEDYFTIVKDTSDFLLTAVQFASGDVQLTWASRPGRTYRIEYSSNVNESFAPVSGSIPAMGTSTTWIHRPPQNTPLGFYRAQEIP